MKQKGLLARGRPIFIKELLFVYVNDMHHLILTYDKHLYAVGTIHLGDATLKFILIIFSL